MVGDNSENILEIHEISRLVKGFISEDKSNETNTNFDTSAKKVEPYIFVSFDLSDSTRLKHETASWEKIISDLLDSTILVRSYLKFWKFNGDELLFFREIKSIYQIVTIINVVYDVMNKISDKLSTTKTNDNSGTNWEKVQLKSTIWISAIDYENNFKINLPYRHDFIGTDIDEGFRLTKLATKGKCLIDPKIALLLSGFIASTSNTPLTSELIKYYDLFSSDSNKEDDGKDWLINDSKFRKNQEVLMYNRPHSLFAKNFYVFCKNNLIVDDEEGKVSPLDLEKVDLKTLSSLKNCVDRMKLVGYSTCKGVWNGKDYPIIWYSSNWARLDQEVAYDEKLDGEVINKKLINRYYDSVDESGHGIVTYVLLENIYRNISDFSKSLNKIFRCSKLRLSTEPTLDRYAVQYSNTYYVLVCYLKEKNSILMLLRSKERGHLADTWDFCCQKYLQGMEKEEGKEIFCKCIEKRYGIRVKLVTGESNTHIQPIFLKPIYRKGVFNQGIVCLGEIDTSNYTIDDNLESNIIKKVQGVLNNDLSEEEYPLYSKAIFIHNGDMEKDDSKGFLFLDESCHQFSYDEELFDSKSKIHKFKSDKPKFVSDTLDILKISFDYFNKRKSGD